MDRNLYLEKMNADLREWHARLDLLRAQANKAGVEARIRWLREIDDLEQRQSAFRRTLNEMKTMGESGWDRLQRTMDSARHDLADAMERLADRLRAGADSGGSSRCGE